MHKDSIFRHTFSRNEKRLYLGFDYKKVVIERSVSNYMLRTTPFFDGFLSKLNKMVVENIEAVKKIKIFANPALDKNETKLN
jgi:hypothetical protein